MGCRQSFVHFVCVFTVSFLGAIKISNGCNWSRIPFDFLLSVIAAKIKATLGTLFSVSMEVLMKSFRWLKCFLAMTSNQFWKVFSIFQITLPSLKKPARSKGEKGAKQTYFVRVSAFFLCKPSMRVGGFLSCVYVKSRDRQAERLRIYFSFSIHIKRRFL